MEEVTPTSRAEKIANHLVVERCTGDGDFDKLSQWIAAQIEEAQREAHTCCCNEQQAMPGEPKGCICKREGFRVAKEKAIGIAKSCYHQGDFGTVIKSGEYVAQRIGEMEP